MKKATKGYPGYLKKRKLGLLARGLILAAGVAALFLTGYLTLNTRFNWLTIIAVLSAIPMAMQFATLLSLVHFKDRPKEEYEEIRALTGNGVLDTELIIANKDGKAIDLAYAYFHESGIYLLTLGKITSLDQTEEYLHSFLRLNTVDGPLTLYTDLGVFKKRLKSLEPSDRDECDEYLLRQEGVFRAISM